MSFVQKFIFHTLSVVNQSTVVTDADATKMVAALNLTIPMFARDWNVMGVPATLVPTSATLPTGSGVMNIFIMDTTDVSGAASYHALYSGTATVKVFANTILTAGGVSLYEDTRTKATVSQMLCHEVLEALVDPSSTQWLINPSTGTMYALEVADPVEGNVKVVRLSDGTRVTVSDWLLPDAQKN